MLHTKILEGLKIANTQNFKMVTLQNERLGKSDTSIVVCPLDTGEQSNGFGFLEASGALRNLKPTQAGVESRQLENKKRLIYVNTTTPQGISHAEMIIQSTVNALGEADRLARDLPKDRRSVAMPVLGLEVFVKATGLSQRQAIIWFLNGISKLKIQNLRSIVLCVLENDAYLEAHGLLSWYNSDQRGGKFQFVPGMAQISGMGGDYEVTCRKMFQAGAQWLEKNSKTKIEFFKFEGINMLKNRSGRPEQSFLKVMGESAGKQMTNAMLSMVIEELFWMDSIGWDEYMKRKTNVPG